ncbi:MAG: carboxypeptidase-like regulatory domain-containing protein, partial [Verrucomicrobiota bacterium]|nr:carboxypeptidase-like regulatory domain-containing protein [Verrucomicrobiota bacterium]
MSRACISIVAATVVASFAMTLFAETLPPGTSGIEGTVLVSPIRPGPLRKDDERPNVAPAPNVQFVVKAGDATVKTFTTDGEGRFQIALPPGHYTIVREGAGRVGRWLWEADVVAGQMTNVKWTADSGPASAMHRALMARPLRPATACP